MAYFSGAGSPGDSFRESRKFSGSRGVDAVYQLTHVGAMCRLLRLVLKCLGFHLWDDIQWEIFRIRLMEVPIPSIRPMFQAYVRGYPHKIWPYMVQYLHFRFLKWPLRYWVSIWHIDLVKFHHDLTVLPNPGIMMNVREIIPKWPNYSG